MNQAEATNFYRIAGRRVIASVSGGKDSGAMCLYLRDLGIDHDRVFMDTGWEHAETYDYLRGPLTAALGPITEIKAERTMAQLTIHKGMFPSKQRRWCTTELKVKPMQRYIEARVAEGLDVINTVGIRAAESEARSRMPEWEWSDGFDCEVWRPLIAWSEQDVIDIHTRHGLRPNPLYLKGAERVGCAPCIFSRKSEIRWMAENFPARVDELRDLEAAVAVAARDRYAERGETFASLGYEEPRFFQAPRGRKGTWSIDKVVEWSKTPHGGALGEVEPYAAGEADAGCVRWGLCDTNSEGTR